MSIISLLTGTRASLENPSTPLGEWESLADSSLISASGVTVNRKTALSYAAVWRAVTLLAADVAKVPLMLYKVTERGDEADKDHPAYHILRHQANPYHTAFAVRQAMMHHALLTGDGYGLIDRDGRGNPQALYLLDPEKMDVEQVRGVPVYYYGEGSSKTTFDASQILHIAGPGYDGLCGYNTISFAANTIGRGLAAGKHSSGFFANGSRPSVVLRHPSALSAEAAARLKQSWNANYSGARNAYGTAVLEEGMEVTTLTMSAKDSQLIEAMQYSAVEVALIFGIPPHKLGDSSRTSYNSLEQENRAYLSEALDHWLFRWETECRQKLLTEDQKRSESHSVQFDRAAIVQPDAATRAAYYNKSLAGAPWQTIDEVRRRENLGPLPGPQGDNLIFPSNNFAGGASQSTPDGPDASQGDDPPAPDPAPPPAPPFPMPSPAWPRALTTRPTRRRRTRKSSLSGWRHWKATCPPSAPPFNPLPPPSPPFCGKTPRHSPKPPVASYSPKPATNSPPLSPSQTSSASRWIASSNPATSRPPHDPRTP